MNPLITADSSISLMQAAQQQARAKAQMLEQQSTIRNFDKIEESAKEFEAVFLSEMLKPMFAEINKSDPLFGGGHGEEIFNGFMVQEYGKIMAEHGGIGIAEHVKAELIKIQEAQQKE
ncbi:MAG: flagellar biosynthesis protein FlgJ [Alphaproteobacteria bacterium CG_4_9_14_3_um_filter_47_13]|nr:MAG: flagellar biosynthesis protein FlgJ [Alphaproteobacteria bacterium CG_4_9_14_3_um_filter_47_13]